MIVEDTDGTQLEWVESLSPGVRTDSEGNRYIALTINDHRLLLSTDRALILMRSLVHGIGQSARIVAEPMPSKLVVPTHNAVRARAPDMVKQLEQRLAALEAERAADTMLGSVPKDADAPAS